MTTLPLGGSDIQLICEIDEQGSFVGSKKHQRWLWYAWEPRMKRIVAHVFGDRSRKTANTKEKNSQSGKTGKNLRPVINHFAL
ncbi:hypothetical protein XBO1_290086 [Xenorhabdus bovienii str. oregonense]|uniref:Insertion element iso-IS1n protein insB n=1 Tax=Xenorhabdus bovienii str. oregonense TaxID=1398202 RepID=A0A077P9U0_XENBV|nr:hypothetical protein XBO1_290086 [Xenorhabdus bovienii str. oregonense]